MKNITRIIWTCIGVGVVASLLIAAAWWGVRMRPTDRPCAAIEFVIEDITERTYVTAAELNELLRSRGLDPVGKPIDRTILHRIEKTVGDHSMVRPAECYITAHYVVRVHVTQRVPLLRVQIPADTYFIDTDRRVMQARASVRDRVTVATGAVGVQMAAGPLADFAQWLQQTPYWKERIHHIQVQSPQMVYIYLNDPNAPRVVLGTMRGYESKLDKLRTFFDNCPPEIREKKYSELDLRFHGQVIGRNPEPNNP